MKCVSCGKDFSPLKPDHPFSNVFDKELCYDCNSGLILLIGYFDDLFKNHESEELVCNCIQQDKKAIINSLKENKNDRN